MRAASRSTARSAMQRRKSGAQAPCSLHSFELGAGRAQPGLSRRSAFSCGR